MSRVVGENIQERRMILCVVVLPSFVVFESFGFIVFDVLFKMSGRYIGEEIFLYSRSPSLNRIRCRGDS